MDLRVFYQKLRETEQSINDDPTVVISLETADGGRSGIACEVSRSVAAKLIVTGRARLASDAERIQYRDEIATALAERTKEENARRVQVALVSESDLRTLREKPQRRG